jgi:hypothetical protein
MPNFFEDPLGEAESWVNQPGRWWGDVEDAASGLGGGGSDTQTTDTSPWIEQQPYLMDIFSQAQQLYNAPGPEYYPYAMTAALSPESVGGMQSLLDYGGTYGQMYQGMGGEAMQFGLQDVLNPETNKYMQAHAEAAIRPLTENLMGNVMPQIGSAAQKGGAYGGARQGLLESQALNNYMQNVTDTTSRMYSNAYGQGLGTFGTTLGQMGNVQQAGMVPGQMQMQLGDYQNAYNQQLINEDVNRYNYYQNLPQQQLANYAGTVSGNYGGVSTQQLPSQNPWAAAIGGGLMGYGATGNLWGAAAGAGAGYFGSQ